MIRKIINWLRRSQNKWTGFKTDSADHMQAQCDHCGLPVSKRKHLKHDEVVTDTWSCIYCGNGPHSSPDHCPEEARLRFRGQMQVVREISEAETDD